MSRQLSVDQHARAHAFLVGAVGAFAVMCAPFVSMLAGSSELASVLVLALTGVGLAAWSISLFQVARATHTSAIVAGVSAAIGAYACVVLIAQLQVGQGATTSVVVATVARVLRDFALIPIGIWGIASREALGVRPGTSAGVMAIMAGLLAVGGRLLGLAAQDDYDLRSSERVGWNILFLTSGTYMKALSCLIFGIALVRRGISRPAGNVG